LQVEHMVVRCATWPDLGAARALSGMRRLGGLIRAAVLTVTRLSM
jgi:hypothetical protein